MFEEDEVPVSFLGASSPIDLSNGELKISIEGDLCEGVLILVGDIADACRKRDEIFMYLRGRSA